MTIDHGAIDACLRGVKTAALSVHQFPDGDAVGAAYAFAFFLKGMGAEARVLFDGYNGRYDFLAGSEFVCSGDYAAPAPDVFISLDAASKERLGEKAAAALGRAPKTLNIDHHVSNTRFAETNVVVPGASSTCEIVYNILDKLGALSLEIASALYAGIIFDTGGLMHSSVTPDTLNAVSRLVALGIPFNRIYKNTLRSHTLVEAKIFGTALGNLAQSPCGRLSWTHVTPGELKAAGAKKSDLENVAEYMLNIKGTEISVLFVEKDPDDIKLSFRSVSADVNKLAAVFGGGGHVNAAGASVKGKLAEVMSAVLANAEGLL